MRPDEVTVGGLAGDPHPILAGLREGWGAVVDVDALDGWLVVGREAAVEVLRDAATYTVDDPRFSTARVVGPSMLSLDGPSHDRHRSPFADAFGRDEVHRRLAVSTRERARGAVASVASAGGGDLRRDLAAPLAAGVMADALDLGDTSVARLVRWYEDIAAAVEAVTAGGPVPDEGSTAVAELRDAVLAAFPTSALLSRVQETSDLPPEELVADVAVLLFGGIVTVEGQIAILMRDVLTRPGLWDRLRADRALVPAVVDESMRLEPAAAVVDRYATTDVALAGESVDAGDLVRVSLSAANRDPASFADPDVFDPGRDGLRRHLTFARGPHACLGVHLARLEAETALAAVLEGPGVPAPDGPLPPVEGLVFRTPRSVPVAWR